jgi:hypothetical protein
MAGTNATATTGITYSGNLDTGIWYVNGIAAVDNPATPGSTSDGAMYTNKYSDSWIHEIYGDYRTGQIALRGKNNGTWQSWRKVLDSGNFSDYTPKHITGLGQGGEDGLRTVIALCETSTANTSLNSYSIGRICLHRENGLEGVVYVDVAFECQYTTANGFNYTMTSNKYNTSTTAVTGIGVRPCIFTYNGKVYGGIEYYFSAATYQFGSFDGSTNFDIFKVDYYKNFNGTTQIKNSEVYNSISYSSTTSEPRNGHLTINGNIILDTGNFSDYTPKHITGLGQGGEDGLRTVIALCETSTANTSLNSYSIGRICLHRENGLEGVVYVDVAFECQYTTANGFNYTMTSNKYNTSTTAVTGIGVRPCIFTYNGKVYGGIEYYFSAATYQFGSFDGSTNFDIFKVDYYKNFNGTTQIKNSEVYNSISYSSTTSEPRNGHLTINGNIILDTNNTTIPSSVPTLSWNTESTVFTLNGNAVKVKAMAKPTYSDVGAAAASHDHDTISGIKIYTGEANAGKTYIGWVKFASATMGNSNYWGDCTYDIFIDRMYNSP